jgi:hypothetical protein
MPDNDVGEELAASRDATLMRTPSEYRIVHRRATESFPLTGRGSDDAWARYRSLTRAGRLDRAPTPLLVITAIAGVCWVALIMSWAIVTVWISIDPQADESWVEAILSASTFQHLFYVLFVAALGCYVAWWLYWRSRAERI